MNNVAHVTFVGGGIVLPAREPYDRELLVEQVAERVRRNGEVCVAVHGRIWRVRRVDDAAATACTHCRRPVNRSGCATTRSGAPHCLRCAFVGPPSNDPAPDAAALAYASNGQPRSTPPESVMAAVLQWAGFGTLQEIA